MGRLFGTDGIRGIAGKELSCELVMKLGKATAYVISKFHSSSLNILIGRDTRISGNMLENAFVAGACSIGANCHLAGVVPTPAISLLVERYKMEIGVMISASHNPVEFNGIKIFNRYGFKISDELELEIEKFVLEEYDKIPENVDLNFGRCYLCKRAVLDYVEYVASTVSNRDFSKLKVAVDCANGSATATAIKLFEKLKIDAEFVNISPDGFNINKNCGSTHIEKFSKYVKNKGFNLGVAFDGDADRCLAIDENGEVIDGDQLIAIFARCMKDSGKLKNNTVVITVMSNLGIFHFARENDINLEVTQVGDRNVLKSMIKNGYVIGGEQSGHIIFKDYANTGDGQLTAVQLIDCINNSSESVSDLAKLMIKFPQVLVNIKADKNQKKKYFQNREIENYIQKKEKILGDDSRILIRCSGTEPIIRIMIEGPNKELIEKTSKEVANRISKLVRA